MSQREQLQAEIEGLQAEKEKLAADLPNARDRVEVDQITTRMASITDQINIKRKALEEQEVAAETAIAEVESGIGTLEVEGLPLNSLFLSQTHFDFFVEWWKQEEGRKAADRAALESSYKSEIKSQEETIQSLEAGIGEAVQEIAELNEALRLSKEQVADLEAKRNAAANELSDAKEEVERLTKDNESLRKQLESKTVTGPTNTTANLAEMAAKLKQALPGIYNKRWKLNERGLEDRRYYTANLSATGEEINIPILEIGKYREESAEDADRFRQAEEERAAKEALENTVPDAPSTPVAPELPFQSEETPANGLDQNETVRESDAPVTRAEFEALKNEVWNIGRVSGIYTLDDKARFGDVA